MFSALILAGGGSSRMGRPKALLDYGGRSFLEIACAGAEASGAGETIVVLGSAREEVLASWKPGRAKVAFNETPELGQIASVRAGLGAADPGTGAAMICLVDQPLIRPETYRAVAERWSADREALVIPRCRRPGAGNQAGPGVPPFKRGHPIVIPAPYFPLCFVGPDEKGLHWVTHHPSVRIAELETMDIGIIRDCDTPEDYKALLAESPPGSRRPDGSCSR